MNSNPQQVPLDPEPWEDADTGKRFTSEQARVITKLLQYRPRAEYGYSGDRQSLPNNGDDHVE